MAKYHVNKETGRANICRATKKGCPLGSDTPHFERKEEANAHIEKTEKENNYAFNSVTKKPAKAESNLDKISNLTPMATSGFTEDFIAEKLPDFSVKDKIEKPDYDDVYLLEKDGEHFALNLRQNYWPQNQVILYGYNKLEKRGVKQIETVAKEEYDTKNYPEITNLFKELDNLRTNDFETENYGNSNDYDRYIIEEGILSPRNGARNFEMPRDDGSKVYGFHIEAPGDRHYTDIPHPVQVPVPFMENGQRANGRRMDQGYMIYDTRSKQGLLLKYTAASDGYWSNDSLILTSRGVTPGKANGNWESGSARMFVIVGSGKEREATYYHPVNE